jgi:hypothetical protein
MLLNNLKYAFLNKLNFTTGTHFVVMVVRMYQLFSLKMAL